MGVTDKAKKAAVQNRPRPPQILSVPNGGDLFVPAPEVGHWIRRHILSDDGAIYNPEHGHLRMASIAWLWTSVPHVRGDRSVAALCEEPRCTGNKWMKARMEMQLTRWFGRVPKFLITLYAPFLAEAPDAVFCAINEHELYHIEQAKDEDGCPRFNKEGFPVLKLVGHHVEEFVPIVRRYGAGAAAGETAELVRVAQLPPEVAPADITRACGTCMKS